LGVTVSDFSKENCIDAVAKALSVDKDKIEYCVGSMSGTIFGVTELFPKLNSICEEGFEIKDKKYFHSIHIQHGKFLN
jgi:hypothetical protein